MYIDQINTLWAQWACIINGLSNYAKPFNEKKYNKRRGFGFWYIGFDEINPECGEPVYHCG
jgi:hypothetical protein